MSNNSNYTTVPNTAVSPASPYTAPRDWIAAALGLKDLPTSVLPTGSKTARINSSHILAENIVAMVLSTKVSERDRAKPDGINDLTSNFTYDSRPTMTYQNQNATRRPP